MSTKQQIICSRPPLTEDQKLFDFALRQKLLRAAVKIRKALDEAHTPDDFKKITKSCERLYERAYRLTSFGMDEFFISDTINYSREGANPDAVRTIDAYIDCLKGKL